MKWASKRRKFKIISPVGKTIEVIGLYAFCETNNLDPTALRRLLDGEFRHYNGWHAFTPKSLAHYKRTQQKLINLKTGETVSLRPSGTLLINKYGFTENSFYNLCNGRIVKYLDWVLESTYNTLYKEFSLPDTNLEKPLDSLQSSSMLSA